MYALFEDAGKFLAGPGVRGIGLTSLQ